MLPKQLKLINPSAQNLTSEQSTLPAPDIIEERSDEEDSSSMGSQGPEVVFHEAKVIVRTRNSGEFHFNKDGNKRRSDPRVSGLTLDEIDEELKDPDF